AERRPVGRPPPAPAFPEGESGRIPVVGTTGRRGATAIAHLVNRLLRLAGQRTGLACAEGLYLGDRQLEQRDCTDFESGRRLLVNRAVDAAVIENTARTIAEQGLAYDRCAVGVVTSVEMSDTLPERDIRDLDQVYGLLRTQVDVVPADGASVLNAADPMVVRMASLSDGEVIFYAANSTLPAIDSHRARGGRSVHTRDGLIVLATGGEESILTRLASVPSLEGADESAVEPVLAAVATAWALGLPTELIRTAIETMEAVPASSVAPVGAVRAAAPAAARPAPADRALA